MLLLSVFMCAVVHLAIGNAYIRRARALIKGRGEMKRLLLSRKVNISLAWLAAGVQFLLILAGSYLVMVDRPPAIVEAYLKRFFE
jgi:hypothetical protein